jgi:methionine synthase II (cobalamin-independent)
VTATGIGSLPGEDVDAAVAAVFEALPDLPHLPELPGRGPGAEMVGRTAAQLEDLHVDLQPSGWRLVPRAGVDERRAADLLVRDLDALVPVAAGYDGALKVQLAGPCTLAATVELPRGGRVLGDRGATRDLADSLAETVVSHLAEVGRRLPHARLVLQLDEPALPAVLAGGIPTESGFGRLPAVEDRRALDLLRRVIAASSAPVTVHCCGADVPLALLHDAGVTAVSLDLGVANLDLDVLGDRVERGLALWLGVVPATGPGVPPQVRDVVAPVRVLWRDIGFPSERLPETVTVTPACGLAGASAGWANTAMRLVQQASRALAEAPEAVR